jgi:hypothetical protein
VLFNGALGTPTSGTVTNLTGTASININGTVGATTPSTVAATSLSTSGNLTFTGTGSRITGDFSNTTLANRVAVQTSTTNGNTSFSLLTNGTGTISSFVTNSSSDPANSQRVVVAAIGGANNFIRSEGIGTGLTQPLDIQIGSTVIGSFTATGLAVTGSLSSTTGANFATSGGNVGIGVTNPQQQLAIGGANDQIGAGVSGTVSTLYFGQPSNASGGIARLAYDRSVGSLVFIGNTVASPLVTMSVNPSFGLAVTNALSAGGNISSTASTPFIVGTSATTGIIYYGSTGAASPVKTLVNNVVVTDVSSTGLAVTGALSATGIITTATQVTSSGSNPLRLQCPTNTSVTIGVDGGSQLVVAGYSPATFSQGLAVTGTLSSTGISSVAGGQYFSAGSSGTGAPTFTTRSAGTKVVLYDQIGASSLPFSLGIDSGTLWLAAGGASDFIKSYLGTTLKTTVSSTGLEIHGSGSGVVLASANGTRYQVTVSNLGVLTVTAV